MELETVYVSMPKKSYELVLHTMGQTRTQGFAIPLQLRRDNHVYTAGSWQQAWQQTRLAVCLARRKLTH